MASIRPFAADSEIDFLPRRYQETNANRRTRLWKITFLSLFLVALPAVSITQYRMGCKFQSQLDQLAERHAQSQADQARLVQLQSELHHASASARLLTYLRHNWPTSQWLAGLIEPLPESITLETVAMSLGQANRVAPNRIGQPEQETAEVEGQPGAVVDLIELRKQRPGAILVQLTGVTTNKTHLHHYLSKLAKSPWFDQAVLESIESESSDRREVALSRFEAVLVVAPGYGQPGGPVGSPEDTAAQTTENSHAAKPSRRDPKHALPQFVEGQPS